MLKFIANPGLASVDPKLTMDVAIASWPDITLDVPDHFYAILWIILILTMILLIMLVAALGGLIVKVSYDMVKQSRAAKHNSDPLNRQISMPSISEAVRRRETEPDGLRIPATQTLI